MKNLSIRTTISGLMILLLLLNFSLLVFAQETTRVSLQQVDTTDDTVTVDVMVENVTNLYGVQFDIAYDPAAVSVQDVESDQAGIQIAPGMLLPSGSGESFIVANKVDEAEGKITFAMTLLNPTPAANGSGSVARVTFNRLQNVPSVIDVAYVKLVSDELQTIPSETGSLSIGIQEQEPAAPATAAETPPPTDSGSFPWWLVAVAIMFLGVVLLGGLIVIGSKSKSVAPAKTQPPTKPQQSVRPSGSRPSAFKQRPVNNELRQKP